MMKHLLLVAHGSRRPDSNDEVRALTDRLRADNNVFDAVDCAFLELAEPGIPDGLRQAIARGAKEITVLPYFLSAGRHVVEDIPNDVNKVQQQRPDIKITVATHIGAADNIVKLLLAQAGQNI